MVRARVGVEGENTHVPEQIKKFVAGFNLGHPQSFLNLSVHPVFGNGATKFDYDLLGNAIESGNLVVEEIGDAGIVEKLRFINKSKSRVLIVEGEQIVGLKQNRIINISILVAEESIVLVPVNCVEAHRWGYAHQAPRTRVASMASNKLRGVMKKELVKNILNSDSYRSDQQKIWRKIDEYQVNACFHSDTASFNEVENSMADKLEDYLKHFEFIDGQTGMISTINGKVAGLDVFDNSDTAKKLFPNLLRSLALDAIDLKNKKVAGRKMSPSNWVNKLLKTNWGKSPKVGSGDLFHTDDGKISASALTFENGLIHLSANPSE